MYEVTLYKGSQAVAGFDNLRFWSQVKGTVIGLEEHYDLMAPDTRCVVTYRDNIRTVTGWATGSDAMDSPYIVEGFLECGDRYQTLLFDLQQAEAVADSLSYSKAFCMTAEYADIFPAYSGGWDRDSTTIVIDPENNKVYPY